MNWRTPIKLVRLFVQVKNPWPLIRDRLGLQKTPYILYLRTGLRQELRPAWGDLSAFREIWIQKNYLSSGGRLAKGHTVIDVGANIGCFSLFAAQEVGPEGRVIAVEPDFETFRQLQRNVKLNSFKNVQILRTAVAGQPGVVRLYHNSISVYSSIYSSVDGRSDSDEVEEVPSVTINGIFEEQKIKCCHFLKLNCEGAEYAIVRNLTANIAERIGQISMELHKVEGCDSNDLIDRLETLGFVTHSRGPFLFCNR
jgi:FkbM family methyltransferase